MAGEEKENKKIRGRNKKSRGKKKRREERSK